MENRSLSKTPEHGLLAGIFYKNPVLVRMVGIGPVVAAAVTLKNGLALSIIMTILFLPKLLSLQEMVSQLKFLMKNGIRKMLFPVQKWPNFIFSKILWSLVKRL